MVTPPEIADPKARGQIWHSISAALGAELREHNKITGASGLEHPVQAIAVDDKGNRVLVFSAEPNPRVAALMQVDVQTAMPDTRVLVARPIIFDLGVMARKIFKNVEGANVNIRSLSSKLEAIDKLPKSARGKKRFQNKLEKQLGSSLQALSNVALPALSQVLDVMQQFSHLDWGQILNAVQQNPDDPVVSFAALLDIDNLAIDRSHGICPVPFYEFKEADWDLLLSSGRDDEVRNRLKQLDIYQYFFPAADHLILGAVDRGINSKGQLAETISRAPELGHPLEGAELVPSMASIPLIIEQLEEHGYIAEGEFGVTVTSKGTTSRSKIKFRPREGALIKLINRVSAKINVSISSKDFFGH